jgi:8-oxo-dGTP pyrophosphatase MutT (NUDIX family)
MTQQRRYWGRKASGLIIACGHDESVLLLKRSFNLQDNPGMWGIPGGALKDGWSGTDHDDADPADHVWFESAMRETYEELCIEPVCTCIASITFRDRGFAYRTYVVTVSGREKERIDRDLFLNSENEEAGWFDTLPKNVHFGVRWAVDNCDVLRKLR